MSAASPSSTGEPLAGDAVEGRTVREIDSREPLQPSPTSGGEPQDFTGSEQPRRDERGTRAVGQTCESSTEARGCGHPVVSMTVGQWVTLS